VVSYLGLPDHIRQEAIGLSPLLDEWLLRQHAKDKAGVRAAAVAALGVLDAMISALESAQCELAAELEQEKE
jgi:hypothetical protein